MFLEKVQNKVQAQGSEKLFGQLHGEAKLLARRWTVSEEKIRTWVSHYRLYGIDGLRPKRSVYSV